MLSVVSSDGFGRFVAILRAVLWIAAFSVFGVLVYYLAILMFGEDVDVVAVTCVADLIFAVLCIVASRGDFDRSIFSTKKPMPPLWAIVCFIPVAWLVGVLSSTWLVTFFSNPTFGYRDVSSQSSSVLAVYVLSLLIAPIAEEVVCRGAVWSSVRRSCSALTTAIVTSVLFAGMHLSITHIPHTFILSMLLCLLRERNCPLFVCVIVHAFFNMLSLFIAPHVHVVDFMVQMPFVGIAFAIVMGSLVWMIYSSGRLSDEAFGSDEVVS